MPILHERLLPTEATGGGISLTYSIPDWQQGISMTDNQGSTTMRNIPDVASVADNVDLVCGNDFSGIWWIWARVRLISR